MGLSKYRSGVLLTGGLLVRVQPGELPTTHVARNAKGAAWAPFAFESDRRRYPALVGLQAIPGFDPIEVRNALTSFGSCPHDCTRSGW